MATLMGTIVKLLSNARIQADHLVLDSEDLKGVSMPEKQTLERAKKDSREGKAPSTQAGEFVREEIEHVREGKHGARSARQAIAIGLSKARRAGIELPPPEKGKASAETRKQASRDLRKGKSASKDTKSATRSRASTKALKREGHSAASKTALSRQASRAAAKRSAASRSRAAKKAADTRQR
jgi:hypothetical protein